MDLFGLIDIISLRGSKYAFMIVDDYNMNVLISCMLCPKWLKIWMPLYIRYVQNDVNFGIMHEMMNALVSCRLCPK